MRLNIGSIGRDDYDLENGRKNNGNILRFKVGCRLGEGRVVGKGCENARIFKSG